MYKSFNILHYLRNHHHLQIMSVAFLKNFPLCTDIVSHLGKKPCMSSSARIFWKFRVFIYCSCLEIVDIVVYDYLLTPLIISSKLKQFL
jgi:hypothetical protein